MISKWLFRALAACVLLVSVPAFAQEPRDLVRALYSEPNLSLSPAKSAAYFARDLDAALKADSSNPNEVGAIDFDYRYGAQDMEISGLQILQDVDRDEARVMVVFKNFGKAQSVAWTLCRRADGDWRLAQAWSNTGAQTWGLREMLHLPSDRVRC